MKRLGFSIVLCTLGACAVGSPVATKDEGTPQQQQGDDPPPTAGSLREDLATWCSDTCLRLGRCPDVDEGCTDNCTKFMNAMLDSGGSCVEIAQNYEQCIDQIKACDTLDDQAQACDAEPGVSDCSGTRDVAETGPTSAGPGVHLVTCDSYGTSAGGTAGSGNSTPSANQCDMQFDDCTDSSSYRIICGDITGTLTCNCFKDGEISGSFTPITGCPPVATETDVRCGWNLDYSL